MAVSGAVRGAVRWPARRRGTAHASARVCCDAAGDALASSQHSWPPETPWRMLRPWGDAAEAQPGHERCEAACPPLSACQFVPELSACQFVPESGRSAESLLRSSACVHQGWLVRLATLRTGPVPGRVYWGGSRCIKPLHQAVTLSRYIKPLQHMSQPQGQAVAPLGPPDCLAAAATQKLGSMSHTDSDRDSDRDSDKDSDPCPSPAHRDARQAQAAELEWRGGGAAQRPSRASRGGEAAGRRV